jgi:ABC-type sulfate transport system permease component
MATGLSPDQLFLERRKLRRSVGLYTLPAALVGLVVAWGCLFVFWPLAVNPFEVVGQIEQRTFEPGALTMYAVTATVLMNVVFALLAGALITGIAWARHERRYQKLLERVPTPPTTTGKQN